MAIRSANAAWLRADARVVLKSLTNDCVGDGRGTRLKFEVDSSERKSCRKCLRD